MISIVIPCYNVERNIDATIKSVLEQTSSDWEVLAVDDGSSDGTYRKLLEYAESDARIKVIHQENQGVAVARNTGIEHSDGEVIYFLDGDDTIESGLVEMLEREFRQNTDMVIFGFCQESSDGRMRTHIPRSGDRIELLSMFLTNRSFIHICSGAYSRRFIEEKHLRFDIATVYSEDREFICYSLFEARNVKVIKKAYYTYRWHSNSLMRRRIYDEKKFSSVLACERMYHALAGSRLQKDALIQLKTTILLHFRFHRRYNVEPNHATDLLKEKAAKYLKISSPLRMHRDAFYAAVMSQVYVFSPVLYSYLVRII
ncbi:MAG: glycosyltransferase [Muribaculaceae bacterium]|nr:glycosyltransferase [Muribaculaceae bacterium]